jgi:hypothetical protein
MSPLIQLHACAFTLPEYMPPKRINAASCLPDGALPHDKIISNQNAPRGVAETPR